MAFRFGGATSDRITLADHDALTMLQSTGWTYSIWVKSNDRSGTAERVVFQWRIYGAANNWFVCTVGDASSSNRADDVRFLALDDDGTIINVESTSNPFASNTAWTHLAIMITGTTIVFYVNGSSVGSGSNAAFDDINRTNSLKFGNNNYDNQAWKGDMAEFGKWNRTLSDPEIAALAKGFAPSFFNGAVVYMPMIRDYEEVINRIAVTNNGTTVVDHPPIIYPSPQIWVPGAAIAEPTAIDSASHLHTAGKVAVLIDPANTQHLHTVEKVDVLVGVADTEHLHSADSPTLIRRIDSAEHVHTADKVDVTIRVDSTIHDHASNTAIEIQSAIHDHSAQNVAVNCPVESTEHAHSADKSLVLIDISGTVHGHTASNLAAGVVPVHTATHAMLADRVTIAGFLRWATRYSTPAIISAEPIIFVEIAKSRSSLPEGAPATGAYQEYIRRQPVIEQSSNESILGVRVKADVSLEVSHRAPELKVDGGTDINDWYVRIWRRVSGSNELLYTGKVSGVRIGDTNTVTITDLLRSAFRDPIPHRTITTELYPSAKDQGRVIPIRSGRILRRLCPNIEWDDLNRIYRYACGEGVGYNGGTWGGMFTAYHEDVAFKVTTGTVVSATANSIRLSVNDRRPADFYKWQWVTVGAQVGRYCTTNDADTDVFVNSNFSPTPSPGQTYVLSPWRFYDGTQVSPYPGIALLEFKIPLLNGSAIEKVYIDADALQEEKNFIRFIQSLLSNAVWGRAIELHEDSFDDAAALTEITDLLCEGSLDEAKPMIDVLPDLMKVRGIWLSD